MTESENIYLILAGGVLVWLVENPPFKLKPKNISGLASFFVLPIAASGTALAATPEILWNIFTFFAKAGTFVFGSGLAIVPFLYGGVVKEDHWLNDHQFLDAVAVALITPGPVVITVGFIGYLVTSFAGACVADFATFLPCYLFTIIPAPYFKKYGKKPALLSFVNGITAAAVGAITGAVIPEPLIILVAALVGLVLKLK